MFGHRCVRTACGALFACAALLAATSAEAAPSARLVYVRDTGAEDCPDENALRSAVAARLGYDPFVASARATLYAEIAKTGGTYRARVKLVDDQNVVRGGREIEHAAARCAGIVDAMALTMSIAIDPHSLVSARPPPAEAAADPPPAAVTPAPREPEPAPPPSPSTPDRAREEPVRVPETNTSRVHLDAGAAVAGWAGSAPSPTAGGLVFVEVRYARVGLLLEGRADLPASSALPEGTVSTSILGGTAAPCVHVGILLGCGVMTVARLHAESEGIAFPSDDAALHALTGLRAGLAVPLSPSLSLRIATDFLYSLTPQTLRIDGKDVYDVPRLSAGLNAGLGVRFL